MLESQQAHGEKGGHRRAAQTDALVEKRERVITESLHFPLRLYPAMAPLPVPMADHLLLQEERHYRRCPSRRPEPPEMIRTVLDRIRRARKDVFEYMHPFVQADQRRAQRGGSRSFPDPEWLLDALAQYSPSGQGGNAEATLDLWQKRGLLRREKTRGLLESTSVAALLITRLAEENRQRNWLPTSLEDGEPHWWCYGLVSPEEQAQAVPVPLTSSLPSSMVLWTPWAGALWEDQWPSRAAPGEWGEVTGAAKEEQWRSFGGEYLYRWAGEPTLQDLLVWDDLPHEILAVQNSPLFGRPAVQAVLKQEASNEVLERIV